MIENFKIALKRQKKLIITFLVFIFLPSVLLSIFGIRAIRNERFRVAKQIENEHKNAADFLKTQVDFRFIDIEAILQNLAQHSSLSEKDYTSIQELINTRLGDNPLIEQAFLLYKNEEPLFPLFQTSHKKSEVPAPPLNNSQRVDLSKAQSYEFKLKDYKRAIAVYRQLSLQSQDRNFKAQMTHRIARCYMKSKDYKQAIQNYSIICDKYSECTTPSLLPLALIAKLQIINCYKNSGNQEQSLKNSMNLYGDILQGNWSLNEDQFKAYSSMLKEDITEILAKNTEDIEDERYKKELERLLKLHQEKNEEWQVINDMKNFILPELHTKILQQRTNASRLFRHSKIINSKEHLILAAVIPHEEKNSLDLLGVQIRNEYLLNDLIDSLMKDLPFGKTASVSISDLSGRILYGIGNASTQRSTVTEYFKNNFPSWRIEFFHSGPENPGILEMRKNFYFWAILFFIIFLAFGSVLVVRNISHEIEVLRIKSDFVSSVSHEFRTPLTSIKALSERLQKGKVKSAAKRNEYYSIISQDTDKLNRMVRNILDFSKIEDGRREYEFRETDVIQVIKNEIEDFKKDKLSTDIKIFTQLPQSLPPLYLDKEALSMALNNLLENAVKFSPGKKEIYVRARENETNVIIEVEDKGIGIKSSEIDKIFDKFYQGKNTADQAAKGTGLGLTLVRHTVEALGGNISVQSQIGKGSIFSLVFPIRIKGR
jgi:two-component sensor histidine kinase